MLMNTSVIQTYRTLIKHSSQKGSSSWNFFLCREARVCCIITPTARTVMLAVVSTVSLFTKEHCIAMSLSQNPTPFCHSSLPGKISLIRCQLAKEDLGIFLVVQCLRSMLPVLEAWVLFPG